MKRFLFLAFLLLVGCGVAEQQSVNTIPNPTVSKSEHGPVSSPDYWRMATVDDINRDFSPANINARYDTEYPKNLTPLMFASQYSSNPDIIETLIRNGADVNIRDNTGKTTLDYARENLKLRDSAILKKLESLTQI